jgi:hypothetical protein
MFNFIIENFRAFPAYQGSSWNASGFNKSEMFQKFPHILLECFYMEFEVLRKTSDSKLSYLGVSRKFYSFH